MEYKHIRDCWAEIRKAKTIEEVKDLFEKFPRWSGDWDVMVEDGVHGQVGKLMVIGLASDKVFHGVLGGKGGDGQQQTQRQQQGKALFHGSLLSERRSQPGMCRSAAVRSST